MVYDIADKNTFKGCEYYQKTIKENGKKNMKVMLLGNKSDLKEEREISINEGLYYAQKNNYIFYEVSSKSGENVFSAFEHLIEETELEEDKTGEKNIFLDKFNRKDKKTCC